MPIGNRPNYADVTEEIAEGRYPTRWELDSVAPDHPVYIRGIWTPWNVAPGVSVANSRALQLAGIDRHTRHHLAGPVEVHKARLPTCSGSKYR